MKSAELRRLFLDFFAQRGHEIVPSSPLVPADDPTLLFTNAGMVPFKDVFLGLEERSYTRAASSQCCVRAGGKHNDLENVGYTARHHTFFEMLGNFSFGDYFKPEAVAFAWEFITNTLKLPEDRLWISVYKDDPETEALWLKDIGVDAGRLSRCGEKDNFWAMGATGPCGPCTEIFYDHGANIAGGPPGSKDEDGDRYIEIWNLVFTQYDRNEAGELHPIPRPCVDTGMGLERITAVMQGVHNNYEIDLFKALISAVDGYSEGEGDLTSKRVIADHIRSCAFIIADGVIPSNEGRGYVLRRIIRRAVRHGHTIGLREPFFYRLVTVLKEEMGEAYPRLTRAGDLIERTLKQEEERFADTLEQGLKVLEQSIAGMSGKIIPGKDVFQLYDTFGFPVDLTADIARERGLTIDQTGFEQAMAVQRQRARTASKFGSVADTDGQRLLEDPALMESFEFIGYQELSGTATITKILVNNEPVEELLASTEGMVVLDRTPCYGESGGQVGDTGAIKGPNGVFDISDTQKQHGLHLHLGSARIGKLQVGDQVQTQVNESLRREIALNHSATHLLHAALRRVLGEQVQQKGSLVEAQRLRFDFSHTEPLSVEQIREIEQLVNAKIRANLAVDTAVMSMQQAVDSGAIALFGEKYGDPVRVLRMGDFSVELCGGTHVQRTGDIGLCKVIAESGIAAGIRRIEAVTGHVALAWIDELEGRCKTVAGLLKASSDTLIEKAQQLVDRSRQLEKETQGLKAKLSSQSGADLALQAEEINGIKVLAAKLEGADAVTLRETVDQLKDRLGTAAIVLAAVDDGKVRLVAGVSKDRCKQVKAGELVNFVAQQVGGKGGGRPDLAQAGGSDPEKLDVALASVTDWVDQQLEI